MGAGVVSQEPAAHPLQLQEGINERVKIIEDYCICYYMNSKNIIISGIIESGERSSE